MCAKVDEIHLIDFNDVDLEQVEIYLLLLEYQEQEPTTAVKYLAASGALVPSGVAAREAVAAATGASAGGGVA